MKRLKLISLIFSGIVVFGACSNDGDVYNPPTDIELNTKSASIIKSDNEFGLDLFKKIKETADEEKNVMISPLSVSLALAMAYNGAEGITKEQMEDMLHKLNLTPDEINQSYKKLVTDLANHDSKVTLEIANAIFYHEDYNIKSEFLNTNIEFYEAEVQALDFSNGSSTLNTINNWVKVKTHEKIDKILDVISPYDVMVLLNAVYFNADWTYQFDKDDTADRVFFDADGSSKNVPTMMIEEHFNYCEQDQFELLELPYGGEKFSMLIFLPKDNYSTGDVINVMDSDKIDEWLDEMNSWKKKVFFPKFEFKYENGLNDELQALGMTDAFNVQNADFRGITEDQQIYISEVKHKSYIKVDEEGTEAAAVTGVVFETTSIGENDIFAVDHPFVFAIKEKDTNSILFIGEVIDPLLEE